MKKSFWLHYQESIKGETIARIAGNVNQLSYWQDLLFFNFLFYCLPISFIAAIPSIIMAIKDGYTVIAVVDVISLFLLSIVTFLHAIPLKIRKCFIICIFYMVSIFLIDLLGYDGPGIFFLFAITILIALVFPKSGGYWSIATNTLILSFYAVVVHFNLFHTSLSHHYTIGRWIAFSCNLIFLSLVLVALINRIFQSLQDTITHQLNTERTLYRTNLKIKNSELNLKVIFESSIDGFLLLDEEYKIKAFNTKAKQYVLLNADRDDFEVGGDIFDYVEDSRRAFFKAAINKVYNGEIVEYDRRYRTNDKSIQWIRYSITPVYEDQYIKGACITGRDVTSRKLYVKNVEDQNKTFREISWMQSHIIRAPLARLMGLIDVLKISRDDDEFNKTIDYIILSAHELDSVINKITIQSNTILDKYTPPSPIDNLKIIKNVLK